MMYWEVIAERLCGRDRCIEWTRVVGRENGITWAAKATLADGRCFMAQADDLTSAFQMLESSLSEAAEEIGPKR